MVFFLHEGRIDEHRAYTQRHGIEGLAECRRPAACVEFAEIWLDEVSDALAAAGQREGEHHDGEHQHEEHGRGDLGEFLYALGDAAKHDEGCGAEEQGHHERGFNRRGRHAGEDAGSGLRVSGGEAACKRAEQEIQRPSANHAVV